MTVNTGINSSLLRPQTFHVLTYLRGNRALTPLPQRLCLIGPQSAAALATAGVVIQIDDPTQTDALFGIGSYMALMARKAFETMAVLGQGPALFACPLAETTTKRQETITLAGTATEDKDLIIRIAGRFIVVGIANGTTAANASTALKNKLDELKALLPVTAAVATPVVTCSDVTKGTLGLDVTYESVQVPAGLTVAFAQTVAGAGALDIQTALDAIAGQEFDAVAISNHISADVTEINTHIASTWAASEKKPRWFFIGEPGSIGTATTLATAANHEGVVVVSWEQSRSLPCEIATAAAVGALSKNRPNANYDGMQLPLYPPPVAYAYTNAEIETALNAGLTPLSPLVDPASKSVVEGIGKIERMVTTRTTLSSIPFVLLRDLGVSRTAWAIAKQYDIAYAAKFGSAANPDGVLLTEDTEAQLRDMVLNIDYAAQDSQWIENVDEDKAKLVVERDSSAIGRLNVDSAYTIVVGLHQVAFIHRAQVG